MQNPEQKKQMVQTIVYTSVGNVCVDSTGMRDTNTRDKKKKWGKRKKTLSMGRLEREGKTSK